MSQCREGPGQFGVLDDTIERIRAILIYRKRATAEIYAAVAVERADGLAVGIELKEGVGGHGQCHCCRQAVWRSSDRKRSGVQANRPSIPGVVSAQRHRVSAAFYDRTPAAQRSREGGISVENLAVRSIVISAQDKGPVVINDAPQTAQRRVCAIQ